MIAEEQAAYKRLGVRPARETRQRDGALIELVHGVPVPDVTHSAFKVIADFGRSFRPYNKAASPRCMQGFMAHRLLPPNRKWAGGPARRETRGPQGFRLTHGRVN